MIFLKLFLAFFKIGAFTFGGGYAMIPIVMDTVISNGWLTEEEILQFIAVAESTPGPVAINMATFVGSSQGGFLGSVCATLGVVLPSFIVIIVISALLKNFLKYKGVNAFLSGVRPAVVGMIVATSLTIAMSTLFAYSDVTATPTPDWRALVILGLLAAAHFFYKKLRGKKPSPILMIVLSALLGMLLYSPIIPL